jgi:hypothetical protein
MRYAGQNFIYPVAKSHGNRHTTFPKDAAVIHVDIFTQSEGGQVSDQAVSQPPWAEARIPDLFRDCGQATVSRAYPYPYPYQPQQAFT